ncbi:protein ROLLING AND ERECT LEAF 2-like [Vicia villosa]|uniref:protein ROLLING AND ERECT LEAF 2-like n=1 Tax=Vicia villosa TaxID=3911 RepID=UPI00273C18A7|nr:protein ROLLING AND ERECT LEAF 2-like [Vicia villosa]
MGCSQSKLDDEEAVQICKDRKRFIKEAVEHRTQFANGHVAYIRSLERVSAALLEYFEGDEGLKFSLDSIVTPPVKNEATPETIEVGSSTTALKVSYSRSSGNPVISVEEKPPSQEMGRVEVYSPPRYQYGNDGYFGMQASSMNASIFAYSPNNRPVAIPPTSPPRSSSQWDSFWNPFMSLDYYGYPNGCSLDEIVMDAENRELRQVREEEGIPDLEHEEEDTKKEGFVVKRNVAEERNEIDVNSSKEAVVKDVDEHKEEKKEGTDAKTETAQVNGGECFQVSKSQTSGHMESSHQEIAIDNQEANEETPGFTVYVNRRPANMAEVIKDLEAQFTVVCNAANDVSVLLEAKKVQHLSTSNELSASRLLNPVALFRSASSSSSPSKSIMNFSNSRDEAYEDINDPPSGEGGMLSASHQSTLDRLYTWEKKLYEEVRSGTRFRLAYEKKCLQLKNHDIKGEEPSSVDKTRLAIRDLRTQITVSIHSVEAISRRIETLRDEELHPQLLKMLQGLAKMWKVMAECHQTQKQTMEEVNIILDGIAARKHSSMSITDPLKLALSASILETELRNWRNTFESWISSQRSYIHAITGWLLRCMRCEPDASKLISSPRRSSCSHPLFGLCVQWSRRLDAIQETAVLEGLDLFAAGLGSFYSQQLKEDSAQNVIVGSNGNMEIVEVGKKEKEEVVEVAVKVLCGGMSSAMSSMAEFAIDYAKGYNDLVKQWENGKLQENCEPVSLQPAK